MPFVKGQSGNPTGRKKGTKSVMPKKLVNSAMKQLEDAVMRGEKWAIKEVLNRSFPVIKPITAPDTPEHLKEVARAKNIQMKNSKMNDASLFGNVNKAYAAAKAGAKEAI